MVCGESWADYNTAQDLARKHARQTGHYVTGEKAIAFSYGKEK